MIFQTEAKTTSIPALVSSPVQNGLLQHKCHRCGSQDDERKEERNKQLNLQRRSIAGTGPAAIPPVVHEVLNSPGEPLNRETRAFMEPRFGHDFSKVRVHTDTKAEDSSRAINARAYTVGHNIVFGPGNYAPGTTDGNRLLAHELAHVVQQGQSGRLEASAISKASDVSEREAEHAASEIAGMESNLPSCFPYIYQPPAYQHQPVLRTLHSYGLIQRQTHLDPDCEDLLAQIVARLIELKERAEALILNPLNLPQSGPMSVDGHKQQFQNKQTNFRRMLNQWDTNNCGPGYVPQEAWKWATMPVPSPAPSSSPRVSETPVRQGSDITGKEVATVVGVGVGAYIAYRVIRMLPSLLPPLWWTIPANAAVP